MITDRQTYALTHPITRPGYDDIDPFRRIDTQPDGNLLVTILAVDR